MGYRRRCSVCGSNKKTRLVITEIGRQWRCESHEPPPPRVEVLPPQDPTVRTLSPFGRCACGAPGIVRESGTGNLLCQSCGLQDAGLGMPTESIGGREG